MNAAEPTLPDIPTDRADARHLWDLQRRWLDAWPAALECWSRFTRLRPPTLCLTHQAAKQEGLSGSFAMIRLDDLAVVIDLCDILDQRLGGFAVEILAHEIGHHVLAPARLADHVRLLSRIRWALPTVEQHAPMVANLYTDLLINDRLQRRVGLRMAEVYRQLRSGRSGGDLWDLYLRTYEILWNLERGFLGPETVEDRVEGDAWLASRLVRSYADHWLDGGGRFGALLLPYLLEDEASQAALAVWHDTRDAGRGGLPSGLTELDPGERAGAIHPARDPELNGGSESTADGAPTGEAAAPEGSRGQAREPFEYGEILRAAGIRRTDHEIAVAYYREQALPHLVPFPTVPAPNATEPLPEGLEPWEIGHPLDAIDWLETVVQSPFVVPGMTTVQRAWGTSPGREERPEPFDLDLYVDSSGSIPDPQRRISHLTLAGAIVCLSALRAGARVQATLWSGKHQVTTTEGFGRDEGSILRVLTGYYGGGTQFPIHVLRDTMAKRRPDSRPVHVLVISDEGVSTMFDDDERGESGWKVVPRALEQARGGGTLVLQLSPSWETSQGWNGSLSKIRRARDEQGWHVHHVAGWDDLVVFAREFSRRRYGGDR